MTKDTTDVLMEWTVVDILWGWKYKVKLDESDFEVIAYASWKMKKNKIKIIAWDKVQVSVNPYEITQGRIVFRGTWK